jgi:hypothetical protein
MAPRPWSLFLALALVTSACTTWKVDYRRSQAETAHSRGPVPTLVGKRCADASCRCRGPHDGAEEPPPPAGKKRIEIRMSATNGKVALDSPSAGHFEQAGPQEACYYVDLEVGLIHDFHVDSQEETSGRGVVPHVHIAEYGPAGPYWYDIVDITCGQGARSCDLDLAREWADGWLTKRKRGRLDPCGSMVVTGLRWTTSGGEEAHKGGLLRDFESSFTLDVKKFATQFPPGAAECGGKA